MTSNKLSLIVMASVVGLLVFVGTSAAQGLGDQIGGGSGQPLTPTELILGSREIGHASGGFDGTLSAQDRFGSALAGLGDVDGDGMPDLAVGAPYDDDGGALPNSNVGAVWILLRNADGSVLESVKISASEGGWLPSLNDGDGFGSALAALGDLDGDGVPDLAVGAPGDDDGGGNPQADLGAVYVLFLNADGTVKSSRKISQATGDLGSGLSVGDGFGSALAAPGDMGADGLTELVVGVPFDDAAGDDAGALWVLDLAADGSVDASSRIDGQLPALSGLAAGDWFGWSVTGVGDLDHDGDLDLAVGAIGDDDGGATSLSNRGAVWILFLDPIGGVDQVAKLSDTQGGTDFGLGNTDYFGSSVAWLGGLANRLAVGARFDDDGALNSGAVYLLSLSPTGAAKEAVKLSATEGDFPGTLDAVDNFGTAVAAIGDVGGNQFQDLAIGAPGTDVAGGGSDVGAVWELFLNQPDDIFLGPGPGASTGAMIRVSTTAVGGGGGGSGLVFGLDLGIQGGAPGSAGVFVLGPPTPGLPVLGQTLIPAPDLVVGLVLDGNGSLFTHIDVPGGTIAPGLVGQLWFSDAHAPGGFSASTAFTLPMGGLASGTSGPAGSSGSLAP